MGVFFASFLFLGLSCFDNIEISNGFYSSEHGYVDIQMQAGWFRSDICLELVSNLMMTDGCVNPEIRLNAEQVWLDVPIVTGVGPAEVGIQVTPEDIYIPLDSFGTVWQWTKQSLPYSNEERIILIDQANEQIQQFTNAWAKGTFALLNPEGDIKGALVFSNDEVRIFVFDLFWYTPVVQYSTIVEENGDWLLYFESEPTFFDEVSVLRVHPLQNIVTVPRGNFPTKQDIRYHLSSDPPSFVELKKLAEIQRQESVQAEQEWLQQEASRLLKDLTTEEGCLSWNPSSLDVNRLVGYQYSMEWTTECEFVIGPVEEQHTRRFSGRLRVLRDVE